MRERMDFDVVIIGAGPAGLAASIRLAQLSQADGQTIEICVIDKGAEVGAHIVSGAVLEPRALNELFPDWQQRQPPSMTAVTSDRFSLLTKNNAWRLPTPPMMRNHGNYIISLSQFCRWLAIQAENLGINIFPGFAATEVVYEDNRVVGVITGDKGLDKHKQPKANFQAGMELRAKQVIFAEGCRGSLTQTLFSRYDLRQGVDPQTYGLGLKEVWEVPADCHRRGSVEHTVGWPLDNNTYGGSFLYHFGENLVSIGFVVGLDYTNPYLNPYEVFQQFKMHPSIYPLLAKSKRLAYGARTLIEGGIQALPKLTFPGGVIVGDAAGFLNVPKIKGIHAAMKSGMLAAESIYAELDTQQECTSYTTMFKQSWLHDELVKVRNIRPAMHYGLRLGLLYSAIDTYLLRGHAPWTLHHQRADHDSLQLADKAKPISYPKHDNVVSFDLSQSLYLANLTTDDNEPNHLQLRNPLIPIDVNYRLYAAPETRYCPAGVYEIVHTNQQPALHMNYANCLQCKACDIKDPRQNIHWTPPEGGEGPQYSVM